MKKLLKILKPGSTKLSIYHQVLILNLAILFLIFLVLIITFKLFFKNQYIKIFKEEISITKQTLYVSLKPLLLTEDFDRIEKILLSMVSETRIRSIKLANPLGEVILSISVLDGNVQLSYTPMEAISMTKEAEIERDNYILTVFPVTGVDRDEILAWLEIEYSKELINKIIDDTIKLFFLMGFIGTILITVLVTIFFEHFKKEFRIFTSYLSDIPDKKGSTLNYSFSSKEFHEFKEISENISKILYQQERELISEKVKIEKILSSLNEAVIYTDFDLNIIYTNRAFEKLVNMDSKSIINRRINELLNLINNDKKSSFWVTFELYRKLITDEIIHSEITFEEVYLHTSERIQKILELSVIPLREYDLRGLLFIIRDITHRKILEHELVKIQKFEAIDRLAGGVAHDLRNLLAGLYNYLHILKMKLKDGLGEEPLLERIEKVLERASTLSSQLLSLSKGGAPLRKAEDLKELIYEVAEFCFSGSQIVFDLKVKAQIDRVLVDPQQLALVFQNLFINARDAMPGGGKVSVEIDIKDLEDEEIPPLPRGTYVVISVSDTGPGIPQEILPYIFDPFFTTKEKGTGLGLTIVFQIMRNHGGHVTVETEVGKGTTFYLYLPYLKGEEEKKPKEEVSTSREIANKKLLVVDDEEDIRESLVFILQELGYEALSAGSAEEAIRIFERELKAGKPFGIVIIDYTMPDLSGDILLERLRNIYPNFTAILSTGYADIPAVTHFSSFGFDRLLLKPYTIEDLLKAIS